jgi:hypothetical protein
MKVRLKMAQRLVTDDAALAKLCLPSVRAHNLPHHSSMVTLCIMTYLSADVRVVSKPEITASQHLTAASRQGADFKCDGSSRMFLHDARNRFSTMRGTGSPPLVPALGLVCVDGPWLNYFSRSSRSALVTSFDLGVTRSDDLGRWAHIDGGLIVICHVTRRYSEKGEGGRTQEVEWSKRLDLAR